VPSVRFSRDKRGYEYVYLVHAPVRRGKQGRTRVLYWYRTPPGVRIGRKPFDEEVQRTLEQQNPGLTFDWEAIVATPMPPPDMTEFWREKRRAEKAARLERRAQENGESDAPPAGPESAQEPAEPESSEAVSLEASPEPQGSQPIGENEEPSAEEAGTADAERQEVAGAEPAVRKRRRRRGGRRRSGRTEGADSATPLDASADAGEPEPSEVASDASEDVPDDRGPSTD
jgi:hypothetical protein